MDSERLLRMIDGEVARLREAAPRTSHETRHGPAQRAGHAAPIPLLPEAEPALPERDAYALDDFLAYHDEDFVRNAYRGLLRREPDPEGSSRFLHALRRGELAKVEILGRIRFSQEGRRGAVPVRGLLLPFFVRSLRRVPLLGRALGIAQYLWRLPELARTHERFEAAYFERERELRKSLNRAIAQITRTMGLADDALADDALALRQAQQGTSEAVGALQSAARSLHDAVAQHAMEMGEQRRQAQGFHSSLLALRSNVDTIASTRPIQQAMLGARNARRFDELYIEFEDQFRGTREEIRERLQVYLPLVRAAAAGGADRPVLDLGCGRGEWLELLRDNGLVARGIDLNPLLVQANRERGLDVVEMDALAALSALDAGSVGAITGMHIIEHLSTEELLQLLQDTLRVLAPGGVAAFETPNPENIIVGASTFYTDLTHQRPLPPHSMKFLLEACGFHGVEIMRMHPAPEAQHLDAPESFRARINHLLFGPMDYAVIGRKQ